MSILYIIISILLILCFFYLGIIIKGPTLWDRLLVLTMVGINVLAIIVIYAILAELYYLIDFAIIFVLTGFVGTMFTSAFIARYEKFENKIETQKKKRKGDTHAN